MMRSSSRMLRMFEEFACLYELRARPLEMEPIDMSALAREVLESYAKLDLSRSVKIEVEPDLSVVGDLRLLRMLLRSLIAHAWRASKDDPNARIAFGSVKRETDGTGCTFYVRDTGRRFHRRELSLALNGEDFSGNLDSSGESRVAMMMVQRIVERHQGRVSFETVPEQGSTIRFTIGEMGRSDRSGGSSDAAGESSRMRGEPVRGSGGWERRAG